MPSSLFAAGNNDRGGNNESRLSPDFGHQPDIAEQQRSAMRRHAVGMASKLPICEPFGN